MQSSERLPFILASGSPRRRELIERFWGPEMLSILVPEFDEKMLMDAASHGRAIGGIAPADARTLAIHLASGKLQALHGQFGLPESYVALAADTIVVLDDQIMGKPSDPADALRMLQLLSGRTHQVITGISLDISADGRCFSQQSAEVTDVRFARLSDDQIRWYISTGEPLDKAGSYGIQGFGATLVKQIDGCYYNVMGLPVNRLMAMLQQAADHFSSCHIEISLLPWS